MSLHFHPINQHEYRARVAAQVGTTWEHGIYVIDTTPALQHKDPFNAWQARTPDGVTIASGVPLGAAMKIADTDVAMFVEKIHADPTAVLTDPQRILEVL